MGARPIALLNSIHFGSPDHFKTKSLLNGVVSGIGGYGNCIGIPTVAGETKFNKTYNENILGMMPHPERMIEEVISNKDGVNLFSSLLK